MRYSLKGPRLASLLAWVFDARVGFCEVDADVVARDLDVSAGTVQRWIRSGLPESRADLLRWMLVLDPHLLEKQAQQAAYARDLAEQLHRGELRMTPMWERQQWLSPHLVEVVALEAVSHLHLVRLTRVDAERRDLHRFRAVQVDAEVFPNRFVAAVAKHEILAAVHDWRVQVPERLLNRGATEAWLEGAPRPSLQKVKRSLAARGVARHTGA